MTTPRHAQTRPGDTTGMSPRMFAGVLGAVAIIVAIVFLTSPQDPEGSTLVSCGSVMSPREQVTGQFTAACQEAHSDRKAWTIPLGVAGVVVAAGAAAIRPKRQPTPGPESA